MTNEQFTRWRDFAAKMAAHYPRNTDRRRKKMLSEIEDYFGWREFQNDWPQIEDWDGADGYNLSTEINDFFDHYRRWNPKTQEYHGWFFNQITCCLRAGFDLAVKQSGGVLGFTAGDVRAMYNGDVPDWISSRDWDTPFEQIADDAWIWL